MISLELLTTVSGLEILDLCEIPLRKKHNTIGFNYKDIEIGNNYDEINIYELAHKCKEWALSLGYVFSIYSFNFSFNTEQEHRVRLLIGNEVVYWGNDSCDETEVEAIFKACQWILENKGQNEININIQ